MTAKLKLSSITLRRSGLTLPCRASERGLLMSILCYHRLKNVLLAVIAFLALCIQHNDAGFSKVKYLLKTWRQFPAGFEQPRHEDGSLLLQRPRKPKAGIPITSVAQLKEVFAKGYRVRDMDVRGDIACLLKEPVVHPVVKALHERKNKGSKPGERVAEDTAKIAIAIEGGGMRGCVAAGMISAFNYLGIADSIDVVYGSSAGSLVGAYFLSEQMPYFGMEVYYDVLTTAGKQFIDLQSLLRSLGLGLFDLRFSSIKKLFTDRLGSPVLNLNYLLDTIVQRVKPLDWEVFWAKQASGNVPLKIVASGLLSQKAVVLSAADGNFGTLPELAQCMKASMMIPGVAGEVVRLKGSQAEGKNIHKAVWPEYTKPGYRRAPEMVEGSEPLTDALVYEPVPYRSALRENCTHVVVLRTRGDGVRVTEKMSLLERVMLSRYFGRKQNLPNLVDWMTNQYHKLVYAEDVLLLNEANRDRSEFLPGTQRLYGIAKPAGCPEVSRLETSRDVIYEAIRVSFAAAYDALVLDPADRGKGYEIAKGIWTDEIFAAPPKHLQEILAATATAATGARVSADDADGAAAGVC